MSTHHCCCCEKEDREARARTYMRQRDKLLPEVGRIRSSKAFAWLPLRCPLTRRLYWLRTVNKWERSDIKNFYVGRIMMPFLAWELIEVLPV